MSIVIFIVVLVALIVVHEFGHFVAAKLTGMRVDEFGIGYPPRALTFLKIGETVYTLNWLPFGGFVKIFGEDSSAPLGAGGEPNSFTSKNRFAQALVLVAGVAMNLLFAYILIAGALIIGTPRALSDSEIAFAHNTELVVANVLPDTPAARAGLMIGDSIVSAQDATEKWRAIDPKSFSEFVDASRGSSVTLTVKRNDETKTLTATPEQGIATKNPSRYAIGVEVTTVGVVPMSLSEAIQEGAQLTWGATVLTAQGLLNFFYGVFTLTADLSQVAGPVGIAGAVGNASAAGLGNLFSLMAIISINLAIINLIPVPALDGGRLLFVIVEGITRRRIKTGVAHTVNTIGFVFLILLMLVVTAHDIFKIVGS